MKKIKLTQGKFAIVDDMDFEWLNKIKWHFQNKGYAMGRASKKEILMHRLILRVGKNIQIDHINRNKLDNRRCNLRIATHSQNMYNSKVQKNSKSRIKGVRYIFGKRKKHWQAYICPNYTFKSLGYFLTKEEASIKYNKIAQEMYKEFAFLNNL